MPDEKDKMLVQRMSQVVSRDDVRFDAEQWKADHPGEVQLIQSWTSEAVPAPDDDSAGRFPMMRTRWARYAMAAVLAVAVVLGVVLLAGRDPSPPGGHIVIVQPDVDGAATPTTPAEEGKKAGRMLRLLDDKRISEAIDLLLVIDWDADMTFHGDVHVFTATEPQLIELPQADQQRIEDEILAQCAQLLELAREVTRRAHQARVAGDVNGARKLLRAAVGLGRRLCRDPSTMTLIHQTGTVINLQALDELSKLRRAPGDAGAARGPESDARQLQDQIMENLPD